MTSAKRYPLSAKSKSAYIAAIKKQSALNFQEDKEKQQWKIYFAAFLSKPLNDVEYVIKFYDITSGSQQLLGASENFNDERGQKTIVSNITLEKKSFGDHWNPPLSSLTTFEPKVERSVELPVVR